MTDPTLPVIRSSYWIQEIHIDVQSTTVATGRKVGLVIAAFLFIIPILIRDALVALVKDFARAAVINDDSITQLKTLAITVARGVFNDETLISELKREVLTMAGSPETKGTINQLIADTLQAEETKVLFQNLARDPEIAQNIKVLIKNVIEGPDLIALVKEQISSLLSNEKLKYKIAVTIYDVAKNSLSGLAKIAIKTPIPHESLHADIFIKIMIDIEEKFKNFLDILKSSRDTNLTTLDEPLKEFYRSLEKNLPKIFSNEVEFRTKLQEILKNFITSKNKKENETLAFISHKMLKIVNKVIKNNIPTFSPQNPLLTSNQDKGFNSLLSAYKAAKNLANSPSSESDQGVGGGADADT